jgi:ribonuclease R
MLERAETLRRILLERRLAGGSLDLDLPEVTVELDAEGHPTGVHPTQRTVAHRLIEEFMVTANENVAAELSSHEIPGIHRVHEPPGAERYEELRTALAAIGYTLASASESLSPKPFQRVLRQLKGKPQQAFVAGLVLRSLQRAVYRPESLGHFALGLRHYAHFTSPIRRYPDLVIHRQLKKLLLGARPDNAAFGDRLERIAEHSSFTERRAERAERDLVKWKKVRFMADRIGEDFTGTVTGVQPFGIFVQLDEFLVDGLVPIRKLTDDFYLFEADKQRLVGESSGRIFRLGDPVEVEITAADIHTRALDLVVPGMPPPRRRRRDGPPPRSFR